MYTTAANEGQITKRTELGFIFEIKPLFQEEKNGILYCKKNNVINI